MREASPLALLLQKKSTTNPLLVLHWDSRKIGGAASQDRSNFSSSSLLVLIDIVGIDFEVQATLASIESKIEKFKSRCP
ncbi:hypothetical protein VNO77_19021 [Canavalia gladiata]|uniref:Uncharacterized protein n=1 Tax=Canavalia gladiata TaxID=3824 RepID=A0AAN9LQL6_CANGL